MDEIAKFEWVFWFFVAVASCTALAFRIEDMVARAREDRRRRRILER